MSCGGRPRLGILGGTFDPIHKGHIALAQAALDWGLPRVFLVPSCLSYQKDVGRIAAASHRLSMAALAIEGLPGLEISDADVRRGGNSYTYQSLEDFGRKYPDEELVLIVGGDSLFHMESWARPERVFAGCRLLASLRPPVDRQALEDQRERLASKYGARIDFLEADMPEYSSTGLRAALAAGKEAEGLAPAVLAYIREQGLYGVEKDPQGVKEESDSRAVQA